MKNAGKKLNLAMIYDTEMLIDFDCQRSEPNFYRSKINPMKCHAVSLYMVNLDNHCWNLVNYFGQFGQWNQLISQF